MWIGSLTIIIENIVCFGKCRKKILHSIKNKTMAHIQPDLKSAVIYANSITHDGVILLSPACASFDEFSGFEQRGTYFKQIVASLKNNESVKGVVC